MYTTILGVGIKGVQHHTGPRSIIPTENTAEDSKCLVVMKESVGACGSSCQIPGTGVIGGWP